MWRSPSLTIAKECKQMSLFSHFLRKVACNDLHHDCLQHLAVLKRCKSKNRFVDIGVHHEQAVSTYVDFSEKTKKMNILKNSVKESDKKSIENQEKTVTSLDKDIEPMIKVVSNETQMTNSSPDIIPGKGPPPEPPIDCCMTGCVTCVWIQYAEELRDYYAADGNERARKEIEKIENPSLKAFIKLELGL